MQTPPFNTLQNDSSAAALTAGEVQAIRTISRGDVTTGGYVVMAMAFLIACACLWPVVAKIPCAVWVFVQERRIRRKRAGEVERARDEGL